MEEAPVAPAAAPASEATPTTNPAPEASPAPAPQAPSANIPADQIEAFNKFVDSNGGFEKAFAKLRTDVSTPAPQPAPAPAPQPAQQPVQQPVQPVQNKEEEIPLGFITREEYDAQRYFRDLSEEPEYASIAGQVRSGAVLKEMAKFGIQPMKGGMFNDRQIRDFLNLYAKTVPTQTPTAPVTNTPTVEYVNVGEQITNRDDAMKILSQNRTLKNGVAPHPQTEAAKEFLKGYFNGTKK